MTALVVLLLLASCDGSDAPPALDGGAGEDAMGVDAGGPARAPFLRDESGGVLLLRGTNVEGYAKSADDHLPRQRLADFERLRAELGVNAIRLLLFWEAIEPERGVYDEAYLAAIHDIAMQAGAAGLHVVVDMHQDVYGEGFGFAGAPHWTCDAALYDSFDPPAMWFLGYFEPEVMACFDRFYADASLRASFAAAWARVARALRDVPAVLAYELLNEPSWGSGTPGELDTRILPAFYAEVAEAVRAEDPRPFIAIEPAPAANVGLGTRLAPPAVGQLLYAPHVYPPALEMGVGYDGDVRPIAAHVDRVVADAARMGLPVLVTELGARPDVPGAADYIRDVYALLDRAHLSVTQWEIRGGYDLVDATGAPTVIGRAAARPYPARVAGTPRLFTWDAARGELVLSWDEDGSATGDTVVMTPSVVLGGGYDAVLDDGGELVRGPAELTIPQRGGSRRLTLTAR